MCGGVVFPYKKEYREWLARYYSPEQLDEFERTGEVRSVYWQKGEPVLPVVHPADDEHPAEEELLLWGNRDKKAPFPQTGWARKDSIEAGKWARMRPEQVLIPVTQGVEKGKWFDIRHGIKGVVVQRAGDKRVYMLTEDADPDFFEVTKHDRKPVLQDQDDFPWLPSEPTAGAAESGRGGTKNAQETMLFESEEAT